MTSNLGWAEAVARHRERGAFGFHARRESASADDATEGANTEDRAEIAQEVLSAADRFFRPELLNRVQKRIVFQPLSREVLHGILGKLVGNLNDRLSDRGLTIKLSAEAESRIIKEGYDEAYGARALERVFTSGIAEPLTQELLQDRFQPGQQVVVAHGDAGFAFIAA